MSAESLERLQRETFAGAGAATTSSYPPEHRLGGAALHAVLSSRRYATVATTRADGRPHATPVAFVLAGEDVWLPAVEGAVRTRNVLRTPWLVLVVSEGAGDTHLAVVVEGPVDVVADDALPGEVAAAAAGQLGGRPDWARQWLRLRPRRVLSYAATEEVHRAAASKGPPVTT